MNRIVMIILTLFIMFPAIGTAAPIRKTMTIRGSIIGVGSMAMNFGINGKNEDVYDFEIANKQVVDAIGGKCHDSLCDVYAIIDVDNKIIEKVISVKKVK